MPAATFAQGSPRFIDARLQQVCTQQGPLAAWSRLLAAAPAATAAATATALHEVHGDFAIAVTLADGRSVLAVDRFAVRSLCWRIVDGLLHVASRADELAAIAPAVGIDEQAIYDYLYFHVIPAPRTIHRGVQRLPAGHFAVFANGRIDIAPYWTPRFDEPARPDLDALSAEFRGLLRDAVARQLDGSKAACFLSGGTDSSTVAGMIGQASGTQAHTYSIGFEAEGYDEMQYARIAARHFGAKHHEYYVTPDDLVRSMADVAASYDQPFGNSSVLPAYYCAKMARNDGVSRLLAGDGGDELFGGNSRYAKQRIFGWYQHVPAGLRRALIEPTLSSKTLTKLPLMRKGASYVEQAREPMPERLQMYNLLLRVGPAQVFTPEFLSRVDGMAPLRQQVEVWQQADTPQWVNRTLAFDWRYTLAEADLPKVCGSARLAGVDVGFPFLDEALLAFSMRLPASYKLKGLSLRWFFKHALRGFLPEAIISKKKQGFGLPFGVWATRHEPLHRLASDALRSLATRGIVRPQFIETLLTELLPAHPGYYGEMVWILCMLELWLQRHAPHLGRS